MTIKVQWYAFVALLQKELCRSGRFMTKLVLPAAITFILYFVVFGRLLGGKLAPVAGYSYMQFLVPGLVMMSILSNCYAAVAISFFVMKYDRSIEECIISPIYTGTIIATYLVGGVVRGVALAAFIILIALLFVPVSVQHAFVFGYMLVISSALLAALGLANGILAKVFNDIAWIPNFVLLPLTYLGGVFFSISHLSVFWQNVALLNPLYYIINDFRYGMLGIRTPYIDLSMILLPLLVLLCSFWLYYLLKHAKSLRS